MDKQHAKQTTHQSQLLWGLPRGFDISHPRWPRLSGSTCASWRHALPPGFMVPGRACRVARLRCNQSQYSCSSRHPGATSFPDFLISFFVFVMSVTDPISSVVAKPIKFPFLLMISFFVVVMSVTDQISSVVAKHIKFPFLSCL